MDMMQITPDVQEIDELVTNFLVQDLLDQGFTLSVYDGEEYTVKKSRDYTEIVAALRSTDNDELVVRKDNERIGAISLIYGECGYDVISDYSVSLEDALKNTNIYAETFYN